MCLLPFLKIAVRNSPCRSPLPTPCRAQAPPVSKNVIYGKAFSHEAFDFYDHPHQDLLAKALEKHLSVVDSDKGAAGNLQLSILKQMENILVTSQQLCPFSDTLSYYHAIVVERVRNATMQENMRHFAEVSMKLARAEEIGPDVLQPFTKAIESLNGAMLDASTNGDLVAAIEAMIRNILLGKGGVSLARAAKDASSILAEPIPCSIQLVPYLLELQLVQETIDKLDWGNKKDSEDPLSAISADDVALFLKQLAIVSGLKDTLNNDQNLMTEAEESTKETKILFEKITAEAEVVRVGVGVADCNGTIKRCKEKEPQIKDNALGMPGGEDWKVGLDTSTKDWSLVLSHAKDTICTNEKLGVMKQDLAAFNDMLTELKGKMSNFKLTCSEALYSPVKGKNKMRNLLVGASRPRNS